MTKQEEVERYGMEVPEQDAVFSFEVFGTTFAHGLIYRTVYLNIDYACKMILEGKTAIVRSTKNEMKSHCFTKNGIHQTVKAYLDNKYRVFVVDSFNYEVLKKYYEKHYC